LALMRYEPSASEMVPTVVPLTMIAAPASGLLVVASVTVPEIVWLCAKTLDDMSIIKQARAHVNTPRTANFLLGGGSSTCFILIFFN